MASMEEHFRYWTKKNECERGSNRIYLNGMEFSIPIWFFNAEEICSWLSAAEQTQEPVLKDWWAIAKGSHSSNSGPVGMLRGALRSIEHLHQTLPKVKRAAAGSHRDAICGFLEGSDVDVSSFKKLFNIHEGFDGYNTDVLSNQVDIAKGLQRLEHQIKLRISKIIRNDEKQVRTADSPLYISRDSLTDPKLIDRAVSQERLISS